MVDRDKTSLADFPAVSNITAGRLLEQASIGHCITVEVHGADSPEAAQSRAELEWAACLVYQQNHRFFVAREEGEDQPRSDSSRDMALAIQTEFRRQLSRLNVAVGA